MGHGAKIKLCRSEGCTNQAQKGGVCVRHGAKHKRCSIDGCTKYPQKGGVCIRHGVRCIIEGCTNGAVRGGVCIRHGAYRNTQDESTAFGSEHQNSSTANSTLPNKRASRSTLILPSEVTILCQEIVEV